jgi:RHS repeat-associated protein
MDIIIRTQSGKQYKLIRQEKPTRQTSNTAFQSPDQLKSLLAGAEPLGPLTWPALWQKVRPRNANKLGSPNAILKALQDLAEKELLHIVPVESRRKNLGPNRGARSGGGGGNEPANLGSAPPVRSAEAVSPPSTEKAFSEDGAASSDAPAAGNDTPVAECKTEGEPISMISGEELLQLTDAQLPGPVSFAWTRTYRSSHTRDSGLGCGWTHTGSEQLELDSQQVLYHDSDGRTVPFRLPRVHQRSRYIPEGLVLDRIAEDTFILRQDGHPLRVFTRYGARSSYLRLTQLRHPSYVPASTVLGVRKAETGFAIHLHYNEHNQLTQLQGNWGKSLMLNRNGEGRIVRLELKDATSGARKTLAEYDYDACGDLIAQRNANGVGERYEYRNHLIQKRTLVTGFNFYFEWDGDGSSARCIHQWGDRGIYDYRFEWQPEDQRSKAIDSRGKVREYEYNEYGQIIAELDCEGGLHQYAYEKGRKQRYIDPEGNTTDYFFDRYNNPAGYRDALGNRVTLSWFNGRLTSVTDKDKSHWRREYDSKGQLIALTDPFRQVTRYSYNTDGLLASVTDPMQRTTRYEWSDRGELLTIIDPEGHRRCLSYDAWGQVDSAEIFLAGGASAGKIQFFYTATGKVEKIIAPNGDATTYTYNENDQLIRHSDPQGRTTGFKYDGLSQVVERVDPEGNRLNYEYDSERNLTALINEKGEKYQFFYDGNERLIKEIGFDGRIQHYKYDKAGRLIKHLDAGDVMTDFERDALGQLLTRTSRSITKPSIAPEITRFNYDAKGRLLESYNADQFISFAYNAFGNLTKEHHSDLNSQRQRISASMVDISFSNVWPGKRSGIQLPDGQCIDYGFDPKNRLNQISFNGEIITQIERDFLGREVSRTQGDLVTFAEYDPAGRLQKQTSYNQKQKIAGPIQRQYGYDNFGNLNSLSDGPEETRYVYDLLNRLKKVEGNLPETFSFDPAGNLLQAGSENASSSVKGNRLYIQGDRKFTYDTRGNLIQENRGKDGKLVTTFEYNLNNQLIKTTCNGQVTTYTYDPLGRRISKTDTFGTTRYLWAGDQMVQEQRNSIKKTYIYEPENFRPVAQVVDGKTYHYHLDHLGTPRELTDDSGKVVWKVRYKTYGNVAVKEVEEIENNLRFQGQYFDEETGLHYNRFRYYNPNTGQFITQDPIGLLGGVNNYQYAPNPVGWVDPWGLSCKEANYKTTPLKPQYAGENNPKDSSRWNFPMVCEYFSQDKLDEMELTVKNNLLVYKKTGEVFDSSNAQTHWGNAIFIMDQQGRIFVSNEQIPFEIHHSSLSNGRPVAAAGELNVAQGILLEVSNQSGHYMPPQSLNNQLFVELESRGMPAEQLDKVMRTGWKDDGSAQPPKPHAKFKEVEQWKPGDALPDDWMDF